MLARVYAVFVVALLACCLVERLVHAVLLLFVLGPRAAGKRVLAGSVVGLFFGLAGAVVGTAAHLVLVVGRFLLWWLLFLCLFALASFVWDAHPEVVFGLVSLYNARVAPFVHGYVLLPLQLFNLVYAAWVPVWNGAVWLARVLVTQAGLPLLFDEVGVLIDMALALLGLCQALVAGLVSFFGNLGCAGGACVLGVADVDLVSPMGSVRDLAVLGSRLFANVCPIAALPVQLLAYPLLDANLAQAVHSLGNAGLQLLVHVPRVTYERCRRHGGLGSSTDVLMCTPDLAPVVSRVTAGLRDLGALVDNWLGAAWSAVLAALTGSGSACDGSPVLSPDTFRGSALSGPQTSVGLTDWLMATTNGTLAFFYGQQSSDTAARGWPLAIDPTFGVAAVRYSDVNDVDVSRLTQGRRPGSRQSTTLLGCSCTCRG